MISLFDTGKRSRMRSFSVAAEWIFLLVGFALSGWYFYNFLGTRISHSYESYKLEQSLRNKEASLRGYAEYLIGRVQSSRLVKKSPPAASPRALRRPAAGAVIGRLEIPRVKVSAVVREGVDDKTLQRAAGHVPSTSLPGEAGNVGIAAHRDGLFRNLRNVKQGDVIRMVTPRGTFEYQVDALKIVLPKQVEVLKPTPHPSLTLVTCYPFNYVGSAPKRFIVRARQLESTELSGIN